MELHEYLRILRKSWILITVLVLAGVAVAAGVSLVTTPQYKATTQLYVSVRSTAGVSGTSDLVQGTSFAQQAVTSYVSVATSAIVLDRVIDQLGLDSSAAQLASDVTATSPASTVLIDITVKNTDPAAAAKIANSIGQNTAYVVVNKLEKPGADQASLVQVDTIQPAVAPTKPSSPKVALNIALGLFVGLAVGIIVAALRTVLDTRLHSAQDIERVTDRPIIGAISFDPDAEKRPLIVHADPRNPRAESFRSLRTNLQFVNAGSGPRSYVVTSSVPAEGKTTTVTNLAISLAETGARVVLVDGDLRLPKVADYMGIEGGVGLTDTLIGRAELADVLQRWGRAQLYVLPAGRIPPNPSELLGSKAMSAMLAVLTKEFDYVLIDTPPLLLVTDAAVVSKLTGGAIVVTASGSTKKTELSASTRALERVGSPLVGLIVTMLPTKGPDSYSYGVYGYGVHHDHEDPAVAMTTAGVGERPARRRTARV